MKNLLLSLVVLSLFSFSYGKNDELGKFSQATFPFQLPDGLTDGENVLFGYVTVPEFHSLPKGNTMEIAVAVFSSTNENPAEEPLIMMSGGPGESNIASFTKLMNGGLGKMLRSNHDVVLIDVRGTYYSKPNLYCPEVFECEKQLHTLDMSSEATFDFMLESVRKARQRFDQAGINLSAFNNGEIADDINMVMESLNYGRYSVFGFSAGTITVQYLLKKYPQKLQSAILTSTVNLEENLMASSSNTIATLEKMFDKCETDSRYSAVYHDLENRFLHLLDSLNKEPVIVERTDKSGEKFEYKITGDKISRWLSFRMYWNSQIPEIVYDFVNGDYSALTSNINNAAPQGKFCHGIGYSIMASEFVDPQGIEFPYNKKYEVFYNGLKTAWHSPQFNRKMAKVWGVAPLGLTYQPIENDVPTLILNGEYDHVCPPRYAKKLAKGLSNAYVYIFEGMSHTEVAMTPCLATMLYEFINDPSKAPNDACVTGISASFALP